jgi:hypothetical protein
MRAIAWHFFLSWRGCDARLSLIDNVSVHRARGRCTDITGVVNTSALGVEHVAGFQRERRFPVHLEHNRPFDEIVVDLKGFEPLTSSMPFKKYQSLTDITTENTRLSGGHDLDASGRHGGLFHGLDSVRTPGLHTWNGTGVPSRARLPAVVIVVCWRRQHFVSYKDDPLPKLEAPG